MLNHVLRSVHLVRGRTNLVKIDVIFATGKSLILKIDIYYFVTHLTAQLAICVIFFKIFTYISKTFVDI